MSATNQTGLHIVITSAGRADKLITPAHFSPRLQRMTTFVVPYEEYDVYKEALKGYEVGLVGAPQGVLYCSPKRQWAATELCKDDKYVAFVDDDLDFFIRNEDMSLTKADAAGVDLIFDTLLDTLNQNIHFVGVSSRFGNNQVSEDYKDIGRVSRCWAFNRETFMRLKVDMAPFPTMGMQDFHTILTFLEHGYPNRVFYKFSQNDKGSNSAGGCSAYRDFETLRKSAEQLARQHPGLVEVVEKRTKHSWPNMPQAADGMFIRHDVKVSWQKAYLRGRAGGGMTAFLASQKAKG